MAKTVQIGKAVPLSAGDITNENVQTQSSIEQRGMNYGEVTGQAEPVPIKARSAPKRKKGLSVAETMPMQFRLPFAMRKAFKQEALDCDLNQNQLFEKMYIEYMERHRK